MRVVAELGQQTQHHCKKNIHRDTVMFAYFFQRGFRGRGLSTFPIDNRLPGHIYRFCDIRLGLIADNSEAFEDSEVENGVHVIKISQKLTKKGRLERKTTIK